MVPGMADSGAQVLRYLSSWGQAIVGPWDPLVRWQFTTIPVLVNENRQTGLGAQTHL